MVAVNFIKVRKPCIFGRMSISKPFLYFQQYERRFIVGNNRNLLLLLLHVSSSSFSIVPTWVCRSGLSLLQHHHRYPFFILTCVLLFPLLPLSAHPRLSCSCTFSLVLPNVWVQAVPSQPSLCLNNIPLFLRVCIIILHVRITIVKLSVLYKLLYPLLNDNAIQKLNFTSSFLQTLNNCINFPTIKYRLVRNKQFSMTRIGGNTNQHISIIASQCELNKCTDSHRHIFP